MRLQWEEEERGSRACVRAGKKNNEISSKGFRGWGRLRRFREGDRVDCGKVERKDSERGNQGASVITGTWGLLRDAALLLVGRYLEGGRMI